ncbi:hypothetical protein PoB_005654700 [Plakobranchus ocellatus]|uniref:NAD-dependent epimerase/dehydratase domain-containing protein n=1 Tax=Plakobranchus ocellatus TaxID=259542 RepID=A0AAV4CEQ4_9GAST|nr:hypothetical protein PoB_005654700 [Plakobranchus ocellatus]
MDKFLNRCSVNGLINELSEVENEKKFELATVNPVLVLGPPATRSSGTSLSIIRAILLREWPALPPLYMNVCDVRDVARAHMECMTNPDAAGQRHLVYSQYLTIPEMAEIMRKEFKSQGYDPVSRVIPMAVMWLLSWFSKEHNVRYKTLTQPMPFDNSRLRNVLKIEPTDGGKSIIDMIYGMIEIGLISKTPQYKGPSN